MSHRNDETDSRHILYIDDSPDIRNLLECLLKLEGYETSSASNGKEAIDCLDNNSCSPDLILLDIEMPVMDGYQTCREIRSRKGYEKIPIIIVTSLRDSNTKEHMLSLGANGYIEKPFNTIELLTRIKSHIEGSVDRLIINPA
ncbi:MAG: response regulator [Nitrospinae bacterium]|nr:response regulator [Nitrospinota bacterium]